MGHSKKVCDLCAFLWKEPPIRVREARGSDLADLPAMVRESGVVKVAAEDEAACVARFVEEGATVMPQYEAVRAGQEDPGVLETLAKAADPNLTSPPAISVIYRDSLGWRFHIGGSVTSSDPLAGFSLSLFRAYMASTVIIERLESGTLYVVNQRRIAHRGIRVPGVDGKTVLRRVLLGFPKSCGRDSVRRGTSGRPSPSERSEAGLDGRGRLGRGRVERRVARDAEDRRLRPCPLAPLLPSAWLGSRPSRWRRRAAWRRRRARPASTTADASGLRRHRRSAVGARETAASPRRHRRRGGSRPRRPQFTRAHLNERHRGGCARQPPRGR